MTNISAWTRMDARTFSPSVRGAQSTSKYFPGPPPRAKVAVRNKSLGKNGVGSGDHSVGLMKKAFDPNAGPLTDYTVTIPRRTRRCELFTGAHGELRNPKAHQGPSITDPLIAIEEMMTAGALLRIVESA